MLNQSRTRFWVIAIFILTLALVGYVIFQIVFGRGYVSSLFVALGSACIAAWKVFRFRGSTLLFWGMFFALLLSAVYVGLML